ncbi:MAG: methionyl-tRNA formyltransferase [Chloroflexota bacterium]|nr:methionyl-tRNA formyltransferase [Dehalococcoidia bacterium]MDW8254006.1 methionyl-tRNA formyltransferase [Chloroflexota bacterium]
MRVVFMGTPDFAVPSLRALAASGNELVAVYTQPDRPAGRGHRLTPSPVKRAALELGVPVHQPVSLRPAEEVARLAALKPDLIVVAAFGQILRPNVISIPQYGILNVHASLLPRWRGAAPIPAAILAGDQVTGITIMLIDPGLDTGPILAQEAIPIAEDDTTGTLTAKLAALGADLLLRTIPAWVAGQIQPTPQDDTLATFAPRVQPTDAIIDWRKPASQIAREVRAYQPWPGAWTTLGGRRLTILAAAPIEGEGAPPGLILPEGRSGLAVATGEGRLRLHRVQLEGGKPLDIASFRAGHRDLIGKILQPPARRDEEPSQES